MSSDSVAVSSRRGVRDPAAGQSVGRLRLGTRFAPRGHRAHGERVRSTRPGEPTGRSGHAGLPLPVTRAGREDRRVRARAAVGVGGRRPTPGDGDDPLTSRYASSQAEMARTGPSASATASSRGIVLPSDHAAENRSSPSCRSGRLDESIQDPFLVRVGRDVEHLAQGLGRSQQARESLRTVQLPGDGCHSREALRHKSAVPHRRRERQTLGPELFRPAVIAKS